MRNHFRIHSSGHGLEANPMSGNFTENIPGNRENFYDNFLDEIKLIMKSVKLDLWI